MIYNIDIKHARADYIKWSSQPSLKTDNHIAYSYFHIQLQYILLYLNLHLYLVCFIIQLMHSFEVNITICQPENSDVHRGEVEVNITFEGWLILM